MSVHALTDYDYSEVYIKVNDYSETDLARTIHNVVRNPCLIQLAAEQGIECLYAFVVSEIHYTGAIENRNIFPVDEESATIYVLEGGERTAFDMNDAVDRSMMHVRKVLEAPKVADYINRNESGKRTMAEWGRRAVDDKKLRRAVMVSHLNNGIFDTLDFENPQSALKPLPSEGEAAA